MTPTPTPDYGEPWRPAFRNSARTANGYDHGFMDTYQSRAIACVNACAGMADPEKEIAAMREAIREAVICLKYIARDADTDWDARDEARQALTKLQPYTTEAL